MRYLVPQKIKKENKPHRYTIYIECPECKKKIQYKNCHIQDRLVYTFWISCRNCKARFSLVSPIYKIGVRHYEKIDLLKRIYLKTRTTLSRRVA